MSRRQPPHRRAGWLLGLAAGCLLLNGCVFRQFTVTTDPPGAIVQVNGKTVGPTPVDVPFDYYGTYQLIIFREGYQPLVVKQPVPAPWYEWLPFEFASEHLVPATIQDKRRFHFKLEPLQVPPPDTILNRSGQLRVEGQAQGIPLAPVAGPVTVPTYPPPTPGFEMLPNPNPVPAQP